MAYKKMIVGVDGSETAAKALGFALGLAAAQDAELVVVHGGAGGGDDSVVADAVSRASTEGVSARGRSERGDPAEAIIKVVEEEGADLIVLGNKGMTGVARFTLGSIPNKVSHHAPCDLLIVRTV